MGSRPTEADPQEWAQCLLLIAPSGRCPRDLCFAGWGLGASREREPQSRGSNPGSRRLADMFHKGPECLCHCGHSCPGAGKQPQTVRQQVDAAVSQPGYFGKHSGRLWPAGCTLQTRPYSRVAAGHTSRAHGRLHSSVPVLTWGHARFSHCAWEGEACAAGWGAFRPDSGALVSRGTRRRWSCLRSFRARAVVGEVGTVSSNPDV